ncbi:MAG TPA: AraC family transcriptional regulator [Bacillota bacterium]|nr:AraC family transcriptional regulator [Bacillota bacterium]
MMPSIRYFRDPGLPIFEIKSCHAGMHASKQHTHEEYAIGLILSGSSHVQSGDRSFTVTRETMVIIPPGVIHQCNPISVEEWSFEMLFLKAAWIRSTFGSFEDHSVMSVRTLNPTERGRLQSLFRKLKEDSSAMEKESLMITALHRYFVGKSGNAPKMPPSPSISDRIQRVQTFLRQYYLEEVTLDKLAEVSGLSKYHLIRDFKKAYKLPPHAYQTVLKVNFAKEALKNGRDSIAEIAQNAGFFDESHFIKVFRQYAGTTPVQYRIGI